MNTVTALRYIVHCFYTETILSNCSTTCHQTILIIQTLHFHHFHPLLSTPSVPHLVIIQSAHTYFFRTFSFAVILVVHFIVYSILSPVGYTPLYTLDIHTPKPLPYSQFMPHPSLHTSTPHHTHQPNTLHTFLTHYIYTKSTEYRHTFTPHFPTTTTNQPSPPFHYIHTPHLHPATISVITTPTSTPTHTTHTLRPPHTLATR